MNERSYEEFYQFMEWKTHWGLQCDLYSAQIRELKEKIGKLIRAGHQITASSEDVRRLMGHLSDLPAAYPQWSGFAAERYFGKCAEGDLYQAYRDYSQRLDSVLHYIESARQQLSSQLEEANSSYLQALGNYVCWNNRTTYYWK